MAEELHGIHIKNSAFVLLHYNTSLYFLAQKSFLAEEIDEISRERQIGEKQTSAVQEDSSVIISKSAEAILQNEPMKHFEQPFLLNTKS